MCVSLVGYSERGMVNALCDDVLHGDPGTLLGNLKAFLGLCCFPHAQTKPDFSTIKEAKLIVEQSFSDFGDPDLLVLLKYQDERKQAILMGAKVSTDTLNWTRIEDHWDDFGGYLAGDRGKTSSLFVQLYRKVQLMRKVAGQNLLPDAVSTRWSLGNNRVVRSAAALLAEYVQESLYVAIVPDHIPEVETHFRDHLPEFDHVANNLAPLDVSRWGFVTWPQIYAMAEAKPTLWPQLLNNFSWNEHQIFPIAQQAAPAPVLQELAVGQCRRLADPDGREVFVAGLGGVESRIVSLSVPTEFFPESKLIDTVLLAQGEVFDPICPVTRADLLPRNCLFYEWAPPQGETVQPPKRAPVPVPPRRVRMLESSWYTSRVVLDDGGDEFHIFTHHIRRA